MKLRYRKSKLSRYEYYFKCNRNGKGYQAGKGFVRSFEERVLFIKNSSSRETDEKSQTLKVGTSRFVENNFPSTSGTIKRKVDGNDTEDHDDSTNGRERNIKRIKNENNIANNPGEDDGETVEESLFSNDLLIRAILSNLNVEDLKTCRQVNSLWNLEATKILLKCDKLAAIQISEDRVTIHDTADYNCLTGLRLRNFQHILRNSKLFPSTTFAINNNSKLGSNAVNFFRQNGHLVKYFYFEPNPPYEEEDSDDTSSDDDTDADSTAGDAILLAATCFPNLTKLQFAHAFEVPTPAVTLLAIEHGPELKNLHTLEITSFPSDIISLILKKACNLQNIYLHPRGNYNYSSDLEKLMRLGDVIPCLKNIHLIFSNATFELYQEVLKRKPRFSSIGAISVDRYGLWDAAGVSRFLTAMFDHCSESLTEILGIRSLKEFPGVNFPVFPNVKRLGINTQSLLLDINFAQVFPNLRTIEVEFLSEDGPEEVLSEPLGPLLSVRHLQAKVNSKSKERCIPEKWVKILCFLCPNVTSAKFCNPISDSAYEHIWKLSALQDLHLEIGTKPRENSFFRLDSAFTGFSVGVAENFLDLINTARFNLTAEEVESHRIKPSIVDLKELRQLSLRLFDATIKEDDGFLIQLWYNSDKNVNVIFDPGHGKALLQVNGKIILSYVSKRFGFDMCTRLKSNVSVKFTHYRSRSGYGEDFESD